MSPQRVTRQQTQERISRVQFSEMLLQFGWRCDGISEDLGEDLLARVYDDRQYSGLSFLVQLKSTTDLASHPKAGDAVSCQIEIKDLLHWENSSPPVVLVLWDVRARTGLWVLVNAVLSGLDATRPGWRSGKGLRRRAKSTRKSRSRGPTIAVHLPKSNQCSPTGLPALRHALAVAALPSLAIGKELEIKTTFAFPDTEDGRASCEALRNSLRRGDAIQIPADYVDAITFPEWWRRLFGELPGRGASIEMTPIPSTEQLPFRLEAKSADRSARVPYIALRVMKAGLDEATLSNGDTDDPVILTLVLGADKATCRLSTRFAEVAGRVTFDQLVAYYDLLECVSLGTKLTLSSLKPSGPKFAAVLPAQPQLAPPEEFLAVLRDLRFIAERLDVTFGLDRDVVSRKDARLANWVVGILTTGEYTNVGEFSFTVPRSKAVEMLATYSFPTRIRITADSDEEVTLCGVEIPLGRCHLTGDGLLERRVLEAAIRDASGEDVAIAVAGTAFARRFVQSAPLA